MGSLSSMRFSNLCLFLLAFTLAAASVEQDFTTLINFKAHVHDPSSTLRTWTRRTRDEFCTRWQGVSCSHDVGAAKVTGLHLHSLSIPSSLLPSLVQQLPRLTSLDISASNFTGRLDSTFLLQNCFLEALTLFGNQLTGGALPQGLMNQCKNIKLLNLSNNQIKDIPTFSSCTALKTLDLSRNQLRGEVPSRLINSCPSLEEILLSHNSLSGGAFPSEFMRFTKVRVFDASYNNLTGQVPGELPHTFQHLNLSSNSLTSLANVTCKGKSSLKSLILANNKITGSLISVLDCSRLEMLDVSFNAITGEVPRSLCDKLPRLRHLLAWSNSLTGTLPPELQRCRNLTSLYIGYNSLEGVIPEELSELSQLYWLSLSSNKLTGRIPPAFGRLQKMKVLQLTNNSLEGEIPVELGDCRSLLVIDISGNSFRGRLPPRLGRSSPVLQNVGETSVEYLRAVFQTTSVKCRRRDNAFIVQGMSLRAFEQMLILKSGCHAYMNFGPSTVLTVTSPMLLAVSDNKLEGEVPPSIGNMSSLMTVDLADNMFSGTIPHTLGRLKAMQVLHLSGNQLQGSIPPALSELPFLHIFDVSNNNLSGQIPQTGQLITFPASSFEGNPWLCGLPLATKCFNMHPSSVEKTEDESDEDNVGSNVWIIGLVFALIFFIPGCVMACFCNTKFKITKSIFWLVIQ